MMPRHLIRSFAHLGMLVGVAGAGLGAGCSSADPDVAAPHLVGAEKMVGSLHISWTNTEPHCDAVEFERRSVALDGKVVADFVLLYTLPGAADNKHDASATEDLSYVYRLRCQKVGRYSPYSNELAQNPIR